MNKKLTKLTPPQEIYDVLHAAESKGIELPESVEKWWAIETAINEDPKCKECLLPACCQNLCPTFQDIALMIDIDHDA